MATPTPPPKPVTMPSPAVVANHFIKQYYGKVLPEKPLELHRFYTNESTFTHASGSALEEPTSGMDNIKNKIRNLGLEEARVDLESGSMDAQPSQNGGVLLMVTGSIHVRGKAPRQFVQTFFLAMQRQDKEKHNFFVLNDIFRFLDTIPSVLDAAVEQRMSQVAGNHIGETAAAEELMAEPETTPQEPLSHPVVVESAPVMTPALSRYPPPPSGTQAPPPTPVPEKAPMNLTPAVDPTAELPLPPAASAGATVVDDESSRKTTFATLAASWATSAASAKPAAGKPAAAAAVNSTPAGASGWSEADGARADARSPPLAPQASPDGTGRKYTSGASGSAGRGGGGRNGSSEARPPTSLYVKGFNVGDTTEDNLRDLFSEFGQISSVLIKTERGFAFVDFATPESVAQVLGSDKAFTFRGKRLTIEARHSGGGGRTDREGGGREPRRGTGRRSERRSDRGERGEREGERSSMGGRGRRGDGEGRGYRGGRGRGRGDAEGRGGSDRGISASAEAPTMTA